MSKVEKSFQTLGLADGILDGVVTCLIDAEKKAKSSREIQTLEVSRRGLRQDLYVGKLMVIPHQVMDDTSKIPDPLLKGAVLRLFDGEEAAALEAHRLSTNEFDDLSAKDITDYKDKVFRDDENKLGCVVLFQPAWANVRDYHAFRFTKDVDKLTTLVRHLVFAAYYNPSLSALFSTLSEQAIKLDAENITYEHLGLAHAFKGEDQSYPVLDKGDEEKPRVKKGGLKKRAEQPVESSVMKLSVDDFVQGYLEAAVWTGTDDEGNALDNEGKFSSDDFSPEALRKAEEDCSAFVQMAGDKIQPIGDARAGHLFWLNRNGHGTGFWDEDTLSPEVQKELDKLAHSFGECDLYVSDDGELELTGGQIPAPPPAEGSGHVLPVTSSKLRFASYNLPQILAADKETPEERAVLAELDAQLRAKVGSDANFPDGVTAGDAGSVRIPTDPDSGARNTETDVEKIGGHVSAGDGSTGLRSQPDYGEDDSYTAEANEQNASGGKTRAMLAALLEKTASNEDLHNGYTEMRDVLKSDFAGDTRSKESDHKKTASVLGPGSEFLSKEDFKAFVSELKRRYTGPVDWPAIKEALSGVPMALKLVKDIIITGDWGQAWLNAQNAHAAKEALKVLQKANPLPKTQAPASQSEGLGQSIDKTAADPAIASVANRLVEQHSGEYFTKDTLIALLRHTTNDVKAVFNFMVQEGLLESYGEGQYKILSRTHIEDKTALWGEEEDDNDHCPNCMGPGTELGVLGSRKHFRCRDCGMDYSRKIEKTASMQKMALTYMHPGQVLEQFYPEVLKDVSNYPQGYAERNYTPPPLPLELQDNPDNAQVTTEDYDDKGMKHTKTSPGLVPAQDGQSVPLKPSERSIRGPFFSDQFYRIHTDISPALLTMKSSLESKTASAPENAKIIGEFLRKLAGEIASSLLAAFVVTDRPLFTNTPAYSSISLLNEGDIIPMNPLLTTGGMRPYATQLKALLKSVNDGELADAINDAWAQGGVWHGAEGTTDRWLYEIFVRIESVDVETLEIRYKYVTGMKE